MQRSKSTLASLFLLAMSVLMIELCLTRVFSVLSWHHFAYLIISLALLGFGAAGSYLTVSRRFSHEAMEPEKLAPFAWLYSLTAAGLGALASLWVINVLGGVAGIFLAAGVGDYNQQRAGTGDHGIAGLRGHHIACSATIAPATVMIHI